MKRTKRLTTFALVASLAMILSFIESQIPAFVAIPGIKIGLANIAVVFALYKLGFSGAVTISAVRIIAVSLLFGTPVSMVYSLGGAILSLSLMLLMKKATPATEVGVSVVGGVAHNVGQLLVACVLLETNVIVYYLPFLLLSGTIAGTVIGIIAAMIVKRIKIPFNR